MTTKAQRKPSAVEHLTHDIAIVLRALVAAQRASLEALEGQLVALASVPSAAPTLLTQRNVEHVVGIPPAAYLDLLRAPGCPVQVTKVGRLRAVDRGAFLTWLQSRQAEERDVSPEDDGPGVSASAFAASTGMVSVPTAPHSGPRRATSRRSGQGR